MVTSYMVCTVTSKVTPKKYDLHAAYTYVESLAKPTCLLYEIKKKSSLYDLLVHCSSHATFILLTS